MLVLPEKSAKVWDKFLTENEVLVYKFIYRQIKKHVSDESDVINLFKFANKDMRAYVPKKDIFLCLNGAMEVFIKYEEYEYEDKVKKLIDRCHVEFLIKEVTGQPNGDGI